jgi:hypothetical protein
MNAKTDEASLISLSSHWTMNSPPERVVTGRRLFHLQRLAGFESLLVCSLEAGHEEKSDCSHKIFIAEKENKSVTLNPLPVTSPSAAVQFMLR